MTNKLKRFPYDQIERWKNEPITKAFFEYIKSLQSRELLFAKSLHECNTILPTKQEEVMPLHDATVRAFAYKKVLEIDLEENVLKD